MHVTIVFPLGNTMVIFLKNFAKYFLYLMNFVIMK